MTLVLLHICLIAFVTVGWGSAWTRFISRWGIREPDSAGGLIAYGLFLVTLGSNFVSLFLPISPVVQGVFIALGFGFLVAFRRTALTAFRQDQAALTRWDAVALGSGLLLTALMGSGPHFYDTGLYHAQAIKWVREYGTVIGLVNIHERLGFNSVLWPLSAVFGAANRGPFPVIPAAAGLLLFTAVRRRQGRSALLLLPVGLLFFFLPDHASSPSPDLFMALALLTALYASLKESPNESDVLIQGLLVTMAVVTKPSALPAMLVLVPLFLRNPRPVLWIWPAILGILLLVRGFLLTGYLLFPVLDVSFPVDWRLPLAETNSTRDIILAWARMPRVDPNVVLAMRASEWIPLWFSRLDWPTRIVLTTTPLLSLVAFASHVYRSRRSADFVWLNVLAGPKSIWIASALCGAAFWFSTAPDPRFGIVYMILLITASLGILLPAPKSTPGALPLAIVSVLCFVLVAVTSAKWIGPGIFWNPIRLPNPVTKEISDAPYPIRVPVHSDQCFAAPLPCAPGVTGGVILRGADMSSGYKRK